MACPPSEDTDQPGHLPSLIRDFAVRSVGSLGPKLPSCGQQRLWADVQADLSICWAHSHFVGFVMRWLLCAFDQEKPIQITSSCINIPAVSRSSDQSDSVKIKKINAATFNTYQPS